MAEDGRDMLIRLVGPDGPFPGECRAAISFKDPLLTGFTPNFYSDARDFDFSVGLEDPSASGAKSQSKELKKHLKKQGIADDKIAEMLAGGGSTSAGFDDFRAGGDKVYPADLQPFSFTKLFDVASLSIFDACATSATLPTVTLVKRKAVGQVNKNAQATLLGYMRFLFTEVLITDVDWDEDDVITEKVKFICRKVEVQYFPELDGGTLDKTQPSQSWSMRNATQGS